MKSLLTVSSLLLLCACSGSKSESNKEIESVSMDATNYNNAIVKERTSDTIPINIRD